MKQFILMIILIALILIPVVVMERISAYTKENQARVAEAQAQMQAAKERQAYYDSITAQAEVEMQRAIGERAVLEAAAAAVENNNKIVYHVAVKDRMQSNTQYSIAVLVIGMLLASILPSVARRLLDNAGARLRERKREKIAERDIRKTAVADRLPEDEDEF